MSAVRVTLIPDGPLQVTGPVEISRHDGEPVEAPAPTAYLCRCGRSAKMSPRFWNTCRAGSA